jgi:hypothetical protein
LEQTLVNIKELEKYLSSFMALPFRSKMFVIYVWGYPEVFDVSEREILPKFELWFSALKDGRLDHLSWIFEKNSVATIINTLKEVKKGREPADGIIDIEPWTIRSLYLSHPRGKDESFWKDLLATICSRLIYIKPMNQEVARYIEAVFKGGY